MITRSFDVARVNYLANHPSIRPFVGGDPSVPLDLTAVVECPDNQILLGEHGGFVAAWTAPGTYEIHTFVLPEGRRGWALQAALAARGHLQSIGADHLWTRVERGAENVRKFTVAAGFEPCGEQTLDLGAGPTLYDLYHWRKPCH